ncbi:MAG: hypothetical protein ACI8P9_000237 [Parasphingorhabdus sp.]|jgi:hypothetical protein
MLDVLSNRYTRTYWEKGLVCTLVETGVKRITGIVAAWLILLLMPWLPVVAQAENPRCDYQITVLHPEELNLSISATCHNQTSARFHFSSLDSASYQYERKIENGQLAYKFKLGELAQANNNYRYAQKIGAATLATVAAWLEIPDAPTDIYITVVDSGGLKFTTGLKQHGESWMIRSTDVNRSGYSLFGAFNTQKIAMDAHHSFVDATSDGQSMINVVDLRNQRKDSDEMLKWIEDSSKAVAAYWHGFPVSELLVVVVSVPGEGITYGRVMGGGGATMLLVVGGDSVVSELYSEWVLIHELLHLGTPFMADSFWFMEGFATYAEPIIRARMGWRSERSVWNEFYRDMPRGSFALTEEGLANTRRGMYWGGATFMLLADRELRRISNGEKGLEHCMRRILGYQGNITKRARLSRLLDYCDTEFSTSVFADLSERYVHNASDLDLEELWTALGVKGGSQQVELDDNAQEAMLRQSIVRGGGKETIVMPEEAPDVFR